jgi:DNA repair protein RecN (Recombination protein N)
VDEIDKAAPKVDEEILLEEQRQILENAEKIFNVLDFAYCTIYEGYEIPSIIDNLGKVVNSFEDIKEYFRPISPSTEYLSSVLYELEDLATNLRNYRETIDFDMGKLDEIHGRLELLDRLKNKYHMNIGELLKYRDEAAARLEEAMNLGDEIEELTQNLNAVKLNLANKALALHALRKETAKKLETDISGELHDLGMKDIKFSVDFKWDEGESGIEVDNKTVKINEEGIDKVEFLISTNPGEPLKPLVKIVSGGETSRIMLALKNIMAKIDNIPCLIFDEIDAGIGGRAAQTVGEKLSQIALNHQTLCVTHSPQIASQGDAHYLIKKEVSEGQTYTNVIQIQHQDRVNELARMLGGLEITNNTIAHAREMLNFAKEAKKQKKA